MASAAAVTGFCEALKAIKVAGEAAEQPKMPVMPTQNAAPGRQ